jgi:pyruvate/2-oxoglutarate dehydrogenase complex dihydrolipoamide dehydrogenase (E3) component
MPGCTYTDPEVAHVGLYEHEAKEQGVTYRAVVQPFHDVDRAILDGQAEGFVKVLVGKKGKILGATIVASHAGDMISEVTLALTAGLGIGALSKTIHPYPTQAEALRKAGDAYNRARLTPLVRSAFTKLLAWRRG